jgi:hypothetical protein
MASDYSQDLRIELIQNGEQSGTWGNTTNNNLGTLIEDAISGVTVYTTTTASYTLTALNGTADQARSAVLSLNTSYAGNYTVIVPTVTKTYVVKNNSSTRTLTIKTSAGTGVDIPPLKAELVRCNTSGDMEEQFNHVVGNFSTGGAQTVGGSQNIGASFVAGGDVTLRGAVSTLEPIYTTSSAYLNRLAPQTVAQSSAINLTTDTITLATAVFTNDTAVMLTSSDTMPTGLSTNTLYYTVNTSASSYFSGTGSISGTVLTISGVNAGAIGVGTVISGTGVTASTSVSSLGTGTGGVGTYNISASQTVASTTISGTYSGSQTIKLSTSSGGAAVNITALGTGNLTLTPVSLANTPPAGSTTTAIATTAFVFDATNNQTKQAVKAATTQNITLSGAQTIDGISIVAGDRVLVKDQFASSQTATITIAAPGVVTVGSSVTVGTKVAFTTTGALPTGLTAGQPYYVLATGTSFSLSLSSGGAPITTSGTQSGTHTLGVLPAATNGVYIANASTWTRAVDMSTAAEAAAASVPVLSGTSNGGKTFNTSFKSTNTLGTTTMPWEKLLSGLIDTAEISDGAVETAKIADANVTAAKLDGAQTGDAPIYGIRAWVNFRAANPVVVNASGNVASVTRVSGGQYTITLTSAMPDANYAVVATPQNVGYVDWTANLFNSALTTTGFSITTAHGTSVADIGGNVSVMVIG